VGEGGYVLGVEKWANYNAKRTITIPRIEGSDVVVVEKFACRRKVKGKRRGTGKGTISRQITGWLAMCV